MLFQKDDSEAQWEATHKYNVKSLARLFIYFSLSLFLSVSISWVLYLHGKIDLQRIYVLHPTPHLITLDIFGSIVVQSQ